MIKRLTSWLLVLTMIVSLIPSTMITAFAAEGTPTALTESSGVTLGTITQTYDVSAPGTGIEIAAGGTYELTGNSTDRAVIVTTNAAVTLVLNNLTMTGEKSPIQLQAGANVTLVLKQGTTNSITCTAATVTVTTTNPDLDWEPNLDNGETEDDRPQITVPGNDGMTAGIHVPENATLTIDKVKDETAGELTVQGGYGGAGIGGGAAKTGQTTEQAAKGKDGNYGGNGATVGGYTAKGGERGYGGAGGFHGESAEKAGSITIRDGDLTIAGGTGAAGIGGGRGADGSAGSDGTAGKPGTSTKHQNSATIAGSSGGGSGGNGGNGGNGGKGGSLTAFTMTGGS